MFWKLWTQKKTKYWNFENMFFVISSSSKGWYCVIRMQETKLVCAISRKLILGWKAYVFLHRGSQTSPENDPKSWPKMLPKKLSPNYPPPHSHPRRQQKSFASAKNKNKYIVDDFLSFWLKRLKKRRFVRYCLMSKRVCWKRSRKLW